MQGSGTLVSHDEFALVIVDIQERLAGVMGHRAQVVSAASKLARASALVGAPILVTRQNPERLGGTVPALEDILVKLAEGGARVQSVDKTAFCCSAEEAFSQALSTSGRRQVVVAGMETHICVTQTALALAEEGYSVHVAADACCSRRSEDHETALARMRMAGVVVTTSESAMYEAVGLAGTDEFRDLLRVVKDD